MIISAVTGGTVITPGGPARADVLIQGGTIAAIGDHPDPGGGQLDASGCYVLPGAVNPHCHLMPAVPPATSAAARGGTTTVLSFTGPAAGERDVDALLRNRGELERDGAVTDVGLHAAIYDPEHVSHDDLATVKRAGAAAIKIFLAYPELGIMCSTRRLYELMSAARELDLLVQVHCENAPLIDALVAEALHAGTPHPGTSPAGPAPLQRAGEPMGNRATPAPGSSPAPGRRRSRRRRWRARSRSRRWPALPAIWFTCRRRDRWIRSGWRAGGGSGASSPRSARTTCCSTTPATPEPTPSATWSARRCGTAVTSRPCGRGWPTGRSTPSAPTTARSGPRLPARCREAGHRYSYGLAGVGPRLPLLVSAAVARRLPIERVARLAAENPARAFGHYPAKGALAPGSDADIVIFDPEGETVLPDDGFGDGTGDSVYAGMAVRGKIRAVLLRGRLIVSGGVLTDDRRRGRYLPAAGAAS